MTHFRKILPAALAALLLLSACELVDAIEVAVSGPECGSFGMPPELEERGLYLFDGPRDWYQIDEMIAVLDPYEGDRGPDVLFALGVSYMRKAHKLSDDPAYYRRGVRLLDWAALCGQPLAAYYLGSIYDEGMVGVEKNPEFGACLNRVYKVHHRPYDFFSYNRALIAGRVWGCGLRVEDLPE